MLRQTASTSSRALSSGLRAAVQRQISRPQFFAAPVAASRTINLQQRARWYSDQTDASKAPEANGEGAAKEDPLAALEKQIEDKDAEIRDWKDKYLRSVADFRNLQDRTARDMKAARDFAIQKFAKDLVDSIDNFDRALTMVPEEKLNATEKTEHLQDLVNLYEGLKMTESILMQTLKNHGLERYDPHGEKFNPNEHEATFMTPMADKEDNTVFHTQQKGFRLNGRILRPAKVGVVKNK
ncbi:mitochondrial co-chaperone GrpE [Immersiella caudata]|uniref:GrpE protein homolog n=1 Tax=Immersiella caudata TaxID=314043 RepID=A0AA39WE80_9PEZI|nr:mitochondrial co-chaperone GrpE [Immersiella caudata]